MNRLYRVRIGQTTRLAAGAVLTICCLATAGRAADVQLRRECQPKSALVTLGDVAEVRTTDVAELQRWESIELFPAPASGQKRLLTATELRQVLARRGTDLKQCVFSGSSVVTILGAAQTEVQAEREGKQIARRQQVEATLEHAIAAYLANQGLPTEGLSLEIEVSRMPVTVGRITAWHISGGAAPWVGRQQFLARGMIDEQPVELIVTAEVRLPAAIVVAAAPIVRGAIIQATDVRLEVPPRTNAGEQYFQAIEDVIGNEAAAAISEGNPVTERSVRRPLLVRRGEVVTVRAVSGGVSVETNARARQDGSQGDVITVEAIGAKQSYFARVTGVQTVEVYARAVAMPMSTPEPAPAEPNHPAPVSPLPAQKPTVNHAARQPTPPVQLAASPASPSEPTAVWTAQRNASNRPATVRLTGGPPASGARTEANAVSRPGADRWVKRRSR
ncbi:MAG: flagellar basal body P-ring formation chaperone FlgA [Pirellulales bacterium]|nr:flagellar basal body P-ring formation chaperone FlgA [Pirellulales bacterium]